MMYSTAMCLLYLFLPCLVSECSEGVQYVEYQSGVGM
jgi:hypothetical protein